MTKPVLTAAALTATLLAAACASTPDVSASATGADFDAAATEFTGWVRVTGGEFQLYSQQRLLREPFARPCVSGALPRNAQQAAGDLNGTKVTFTGRAVPWAERDGVQTLRHEGSFISNTCRGDHVIVADSARVLR